MSNLDATITIAREAARLADAVAACDPVAPVPTCPGWTAKDLLWHVTTVHRFWATILREDPQGDAIGAIEDSVPAEPGTVAGILPLRAEWTAALVEQLGSLDDATPRWSWYASDQTVGFTRRMQVAEATLHRVDAELTAGLRITPLEPEMARAVITHAVEVMYDLEAFLPWLPAGGDRASHGVVALEATNSEDRWLAEVGSYAWTTDDGQRRTMWGLLPTTARSADATVRGPLHDLALWVWTRPGLVDVAGEASATDALAALHEAGIQ